MENETLSVSNKSTRQAKNCSVKNPCLDSKRSQNVYSQSQNLKNISKTIDDLSSDELFLNLNLSKETKNQAKNYTDRSFGSKKNENMGLQKSQLNNLLKKREEKVDHHLKSEYQNNKTNKMLSENKFGSEIRKKVGKENFTASGDYYLKFED